MEKSLETKARWKNDQLQHQFTLPHSPRWFTERGEQTSFRNHTNSFSFREPEKNMIIEGSLEVKLPTIWTDEKQSREEAERRGRLEERRVEEKE
jgi:hypothetical protein